MRVPRLSILMVPAAVAISDAAFAQTGKVWKNAENVWDEFSTNPVRTVTVREALVGFQGKLWHFESPVPSSSELFGELHWSADGIAFAPVSTEVPFFTYSTALATTSSLFILNASLGPAPYAVLRSSDGVEWEQVGSIPDLLFGATIHDGELLGMTSIWSPIPRRVYRSSDGIDWTFEEVQSEIAPRLESGTSLLLSFDGKLFGFDEFGGYYSSADSGLNWDFHPLPASFEATFSPHFWTSGDRLWAACGGPLPEGYITGSSRRVHSSTDGVNWTLEVEHSALPPVCRGTGKALYANGMHYLRAQLDGGLSNRWELWSSPDGIEWSLLNTERKTASGAAHSMHSFGGKLRIVGQWAYGGLAHTRSSSDGRAWDITPVSPDLTLIRDSPIVEHEGALWCFTEPQVGPIPAIYRSTDGANFFAENEVVPFPRRSFYSAASFLDSLWVLGGIDQNSITYGDLWQRTSAGAWIQVHANAPFGKRSDAAIAVFNGKLWLIGGRSETGAILSDIWTSSDGTNWTQETATAPFGPRASHTLGLGLAGELVLIGGAPQGASSSDVWTSTDGSTWKQLVHKAGFSDRRGHAYCVHDGKAYLSAGGFGSAWAWGASPWANDVWESTDLIEWTQVTGGTPLDTLSRFAMIEHHGQLWASGGTRHPRTALDEVTNGVWRSADGIRWREVPVTQPFPARRDHGMICRGEHLWVIGGVGADGQPRNDVWSTTDGLVWTEVTAKAPFSPRFDFGAASFGGSLWVLGGNLGTVAAQDLWRSDDGVSWTSVDFPFGPLFKKNAAVSDGSRLVFFSGQRGGGGASSPTLFTNDGETWEPIASRAKLSENFVLTMMGGYLYELRQESDSPSAPTILAREENGVMVDVDNYIPHSGWQEFGFAGFGNKLIIAGGYGEGAQANRSGVIFSSEGGELTASAASLELVAGPERAAAALGSVDVFNDFALGWETMEITGIAIEKDDSNAFSFDPIPLPRWLLLNESLTLNVTFTPTQPGAATAELVIDAASSSRTHELRIPLNGYALTASSKSDWQIR